MTPPFASMPPSSIDESCKQRELLIVGASARAAAQSAVDAGYRVSAIDLFGDIDLRKLAEVHVAERWPADLPTAAANVSPRLWMYTGALENHPDLIAEISSRHTLIGCAEDSVHLVRNPVALYQAVTAAGFAMPETVRCESVVNAHSQSKHEGWLRKPLQSAGGQGILRWQNSEPQGCSNALANKEKFVLQREVAGVPYGAVFVADEHRCDLWGVTQQLTGRTEFGAAGFQYCGSVGPVRLPLLAARQVQLLGAFLADQFRLKGLFGVDFVLADDTPWLIEINPRYTASAEVLERATGASAVRLHLAGCGVVDSTASDLLKSATRNDARSMLGKAILFARTRQVVSHDVSEHLLELWRQGLASDVPRLGTVIKVGQPMFTIFAGGQTVAECCECLTRRAAEWSKGTRGQIETGPSPRPLP